MFVASILFAVLAVLAAVLYYRRMRRQRSASGLTDELIRRIEAEGSVEVEEPLDRQEIREAEERFWNESWDEPEEW